MRSRKGRRTWLELHQGGDLEMDKGVDEDRTMDLLGIAKTGRQRPEAKGG